MLTAYYWISSASLHPPTSVTRSAGFANVFAWLVLGFRCAPPQALRCRRAPRAKTNPTPQTNEKNQIGLEGTGVMRKITVLEHITLDGVIQRSEEHTSELQS